ncbi:sensor histidine kinase [Paractinoplanes toevensis]|uniref:sensor histidine kinase n=1 Tax=Paractinoplanes toevensis TaxID=571911 RepID=UPI001FE373BF|nr:histidine kinase [Actinoplanes toevensis]
MILLLFVVAIVAGGVACAFAVAAARARRRHRDALAERGWLLERERQAGADAAVGDERARIARELHDIVSHNVSVMVVQTSAAREVLADHQVPAAAAEALAAVETTGRNALTELRNLLGLLAPAADGTEPAEEPQPGLDRLSRLVDRIAFAGLPVDVRIIGDPRPLPGGIDVTAFRIVQEALTNALKHGAAGRAEVEVRYAERHLRLEIVNTGPRAPAHGGGTGRGLLGLRERVGIYGGDLDARRRIGGGYRVRARIPLDPP